MTNSKRAWQSAIHQAPPVTLQPPSNQNPGDDNQDVPWEAVVPTESIPLMFAIVWDTGRIASFAYSDLRVVDCLDPSELTLSLYSMEKMRISIKGRNLAELARLISLGRIRAICQQSRADWFERSEALPSIESIAVDALSG